MRGYGLGGVSPFLGLGVGAARGDGGGAEVGVEGWIGHGVGHCVFGGFVWYCGFFLVVWFGFGGCLVGGGCIICDVMLRCEVN